MENGKNHNQAPRNRGCFFGFSTLPRVKMCYIIFKMGGQATTRSREHEMTSREFKVGERYVVYAGSAHFACEVVKRTKATVTFAVPERFERWLTGKLYAEGGMTVTLRRGKANYVDEYVTGTPKTWRGCKLESFA